MKRAMALTILIAALALIPARALAGAHPEGYSGVPWGASEQQIRAAVDVSDCIDLHGVRHCMTTFRLGDYDVSVTLDLIDDKFGRVTMSFPAQDYDLMKAAFFEKYGAPTATATKTGRTLGNVKVHNTVMGWRWPGAMATLERYDDRLTRGTASITTEEFLKRADTTTAREHAAAKNAPF